MVSVGPSIRFRRSGRRRYCIGIGLVDHALDHSLLFGSQNLGKVLVELWLLLLQL